MSTSLASEMSQNENVVSIPIASIKLTGGTQPRDGYRPEVIAEYAEDMLRGDVFPPVTLYFDGTNYYPSDGFQRINAAQRAKLIDIRSVVIQGTRRDAVLASFSANADHGLRRSNADKRRAVTRMLQDEDWGRRTDTWIAKMCRVGPAMVGNMRVELGMAGSDVRVVKTKDGRTYARNVSQKPKSNPNKYTAVLDAPESPIVTNGSPILSPTKPTLFEAWLKKIKVHGASVRTHVPTDFGQIDISTPEAIYIIAGPMTARVFRDAFVTLLFQRESRGKGKRAVIVGTTTPDLTIWVKEAKKHGVEVVEFNG